MRGRAALLGLAGLAAGCLDPQTAAWCAEQPVLTWANFGDGFLTENCQSCHASTTIDRQGADPAVVFDEEEDVAAWVDRIRARVDAGDMPPEGGVAEEDREALRIWLTCAPP